MEPEFVYMFYLSISSPKPRAFRLFPKRLYVCTLCWCERRNEVTKYRKIIIFSQYIFFPLMMTLLHNFIFYYSSKRHRSSFCSLTVLLKKIEVCKNQERQKKKLQRKEQFFMNAHATLICTKNKIISLRNT